MPAINRPSRVNQSYRLAPGTVEWIKAEALATGETTAAVIERAIRALQERPNLEARVTALENWRRETEERNP